MKIKLISYQSPNDEFPPLIKKLNYIQPLAEEEIVALMKLHEYSAVIDEGTVFLEQGDIRDRSFIVMEGWAYRYSSLENGNQQVINYYLPGDVISPFALVMPKVTYSVATTSKLQVCVFEPDCLIKLFSEYPRLALLYGWMLGREDSSMAEQVVRLGRRSAFKRTAHLLLELFHRLKVIGINDENFFHAPITQQLLADTLGLSIVHINRTLKKLQKEGLINLSKQKKEICLLDIEKLKQIAEYRIYYLDEIKNLNTTNKSSLADIPSRSNVMQ